MESKSPESARGVPRVTAVPAHAQVAHGGRLQGGAGGGGDGAGGGPVPGGGTTSTAWSISRRGWRWIKGELNSSSLHSQSARVHTEFLVLISEF